MAFAGLPVRPPLPPMEAKPVEALPEGEGWRFEPKWDGFRVLAFRDGEEVELQSKGLKPLGRYFPELVELVRGLPGDRFVIDGEMVIVSGGNLSFDALQMRLHPAASRVARLARETPARILLFDCLAMDGESLLDSPLARRREVLEGFHSRVGSGDLMLSPFTEDRETAQGWLKGAGSALDGVIAKRAEDPYRPGERAMLKVKCLRSADCVVGGFRYAKGKREVGSLLLGLYDEAGLLNHVGFTSNMPDRAELTKRLEALVEPPGFTGAAPGGPSRWSTERSGEWHPLRPELVAEVRFDQVTGRRFRHGTSFLRWRPDKAPEQCRMEQLAPAAPLSMLEEMA
ncbi:ATP-dependent DNA ligase [Sphingosinicella sp. YJ22]|uniref:ATP-dependent DNA ligase n=1 Tax=Sphingosinicella sp. YJ22 TaxID=1104780 RepID=UPI00140C2ECC|nr:ATP-dependent DNA ligase [Sphingosinicella sp. YJ22]